MSTIAKAVQIATEAHAGQLRKDGTPYINHPLTVAELVWGRKAKIVAVLHDVIEDSDITEEDLLRQGFEEDIVRAVVVLTKYDDEYYNSYIKRVAENPLAIQVKLADLVHNLATKQNISKRKIELYELSRMYLEERLQS